MNSLTFQFLYFRQVLEVMSGARNEDIYELAKAMYDNTKKLFNI